MRVVTVSLLLLALAFAAGCGDMHRRAAPPSSKQRQHAARKVASDPEGSDFDAYSIKVDGSNLRRLHVQGGGFARGPDGRIALLVGQPPFYNGVRLAVMDDDGSNLRILRRADQGWDVPTPPAWSPDGSTLAVSAGDCPGYDAGDLCIDRTDLVDVASGRRIATIPNTWNPSWSPDGTQLVFETMYFPPPCGSCPTTPTFVYVSGNKGTNRRKLARGAGASWSPGGEGIAYTPAADNYLHLISPDGSGDRRLTRWRTRAWSPDGTRMVVNLPCGHNLPNDLLGDCLGTISPATRHVVRITSKGEAGWMVRWSPDSSELAWTDWDYRANEERIMLAASSGTDTPRIIFHVPRAKRVADGSLIFTGDGKRLLFTLW